METPNQAVPLRAGSQVERSRLREAIEQEPTKLTVQWARELDIPEVDVVRALPAGRVVELDAARWEEMFRSLEPAGRIRVLVSNRAATVEAQGQLGGFSTTGEYFNVQTASLDLHLRWRELASAFAVEKPGHMDGQTTYSIQFFDRRGNAAIKLFLGFGEPISAHRQGLFRTLQEGFRALP